MTTMQFLEAAWEWYPSVVIGCLLLMGTYLFATHFERSRRTLYFALGNLALLLTLCGPLDVLGDDYLFSAHMLEHLSLELIVAPLLLLGLPRWFIRKVLAVPWVRKIEEILGAPVIAWFLGIGILWTWHLPVLYNAALENERLHVFQHLTFLVSATIFWWPILAPPGYRRLNTLPAIFYLYFGGLANSILGALLTFAPVGLYPQYVHPENEFGALDLIRNGWGISVKADQQLGGLFMWVIGGAIFLWAILMVYARWYRGKEGWYRAPKVIRVGQTFSEQGHQLI
ncbi:MAG TPA: cytochrome c oxidase assembly protein [candidate division Zixibacteria bacterium]|nr:cytochrome c oxidase assembly protein [candidate division Zixibacteria bacterium]